MKRYSVLAGACLVAMVMLSACGTDRSAPDVGTPAALQYPTPYPTSQQTPQGVPGPGQITPKAGAASPTARVSGSDSKAAPPFEAIVATIKGMMGEARPITKERLQAARTYGHSLDGKTVHWQGWVGDASPSELFAEQYSYNGPFQLDSVMNDPKSGEHIGTVEIDGLTRQQMEQFSLWHHPLNLLPYEKVDFTGAIDGVIVDNVAVNDLLMFVKASTVRLIPGLMTPLPKPTSTATVIIQGNENPAPPFEGISATMKSIIASTTSGSQQQANALGDYGRTLRGKTLQWEGWVYFISPNESYMQQHNELDTYDGDFGLWISMYDLNTRQNMTVTTQVVVGGLTRQQVEQFTLWHDPTKYPPFQKIRFIGTIDIVGYDSRDDSYQIEVRASTVTLLK